VRLQTESRQTAQEVPKINFSNSRLSDVLNV